LSLSLYHTHTHKEIKSSFHEHTHKHSSSHLKAITSSWIKFICVIKIAEFTLLCDIHDSMIISEWWQWKFSNFNSWKETESLVLNPFACLKKRFHKRAKEKIANFPIYQLKQAKWIFTRSWIMWRNKKKSWWWWKFSVIRQWNQHKIFFSVPVWRFSLSLSHFDEGWKFNEHWRERAQNKHTWIHFESQFPCFSLSARISIPVLCDKHVENKMKIKLDFFYFLSKLVCEWITFKLAQVRNMMSFWGNFGRFWW
jgi:hypothetical protein